MVDEIITQLILSVAFQQKKIYNLKISTLTIVSHHWDTVWLIIATKWKGMEFVAFQLMLI